VFDGDDSRIDIESGERCADRDGPEISNGSPFNCMVKVYPIYYLLAGPTPARAARRLADSPLAAAAGAGVSTT
jgi:hypothetical protein